MLIIKKEKEGKFIGALNDQFLKSLEEDSYESCEDTNKEKNL